MSKPTPVHIWASTAAATVNYDSGFAVLTGDICVLWKAGAPNSVGTGLPIFTTGGADAGFSVGKVDTSNNGTSAKASMFYKVLTNADISGGNLVGYSANQAATSTLRIGMFVFRHPNLFDALTSLKFSTSFNTNQAAPSVVATMTDVDRGVVAVSLYSGAAGSNSQQFTWAGAPSGFTSARDPYNDESTGASNQVTRGGHGATRIDSTGVTINALSTSHSDTHIVASDVLSSLDASFPAGAYISAVTPGSGFTSNVASTNVTPGSSVTITAPHYGTNTNLIQVDYQEFDDTDTPGAVTVATSTATNTYVVITCEFQANQGAPPPLQRPPGRIAPMGLGLQRTFLGSTELAAVQTASPTGIDNTASQGFGAPTLTQVQTASPTGIASTEAWGTPVVTVGTPGANYQGLQRPPGRIAPMGLGFIRRTSPSPEQFLKLASFLLTNVGSGPPNSGTFRVWAKQTAGDDGQIRITLIDAGNILAQGAWTALTTTTTAYELAVTGITDPATLVGQVELRYTHLTEQVGPIEFQYADHDTGFYRRPPGKIAPSGVGFAPFVLPGGAVNVQTATVSGLDTAELVGIPIGTTATPLAPAAPTGIAHTNAFGIPTLISSSPSSLLATGFAAVNLVGIPSATTADSVALPDTPRMPKRRPPGRVSPAGIGFVTRSRANVTTTQTISPTGIAPSGTYTTVASAGYTNVAGQPYTQEQFPPFGTPTLSLVLTSLPTGIASTEAWGVPAVTTTYRVPTTGIPTTVAFGVPSVASASAVTISPTGIASTNAFGKIGGGRIDTTGIASTVVFGTPIVRKRSIWNVKEPRGRWDFQYPTGRWSSRDPASAS